MALTKTQALKKIDSAFNRLSRCCESKIEWDRYLDLIREEEKNHRRFKPDGLACGLTSGQSVKLFAVKNIFDRWVSEKGSSIFTPQAKDYFHIKPAVFAACAIADMCADQILAEFKLPEMIDWLETIDYAELNKA